MTSPIIGITMGDPAGVGPEIIVRSLAAMTPTQSPRRKSGPTSRRRATT